MDSTKALDGMDEIDREVLALRHFEHLENSEVAEVLGLSRTAAEQPLCPGARSPWENTFVTARIQGCALMPTSRTRADRSDADRNPVEILADEFARRLRGGEHPTIDEYVQRYPEHADLVRTLFPPIEMMERVSQQEQSDGQIEPPSTAGFRLSTDTIGDFRIIREIGRGGMGVVYEALQQSLNRRVALKILGPAVAGSRSQLARFRARQKRRPVCTILNIVPIFGTGTDGDLHFYVMQFIDGVSLNDVVQWLSRQPEIDSETRCGRSPDRATGLTERLQHCGRPPVGRSGGVRDPRPAPEPEGCPSTGTQFTAADAAAVLLAGTVQDRSSVRGSSVESAVTGVPSTDSINGIANDSPRVAVVERSDPTDRGSSGGSLRSTPATRRSCVCRNADTQAVFPHSRECSYGPERKGAYWRNVAKIGADLAGALSYSHQQGVLHRDIKPSNILLDRDGIVWVADFGLAKHEDQEGVTQAGDIVGTLRYMAPEQFRGRTDNRSDIYSLGLTLYELLTLRPAFDDTRHGPLIEQKLSATQPSPRGIVPGIPRDLDTIVAKACAPDPDHRYESAAELAADLQRFLDDRPILARRVLSAERLWRWARRNPWIATLSLSTAVFLIATAVAFAIGKHRTEQTLAAWPKKRDESNERWGKWSRRSSEPSNKEVRP